MKCNCLIVCSPPQVWSQSVADSVLHPQQVTFTSSDDVLASPTSQPLDAWYPVQVDLPMGRQIVIVEALASDNTFSAVAIDSVELLEGSCASYGMTLNTLYQMVSRINLV